MDVAGPFCAHCTANHGTINILPTEMLHKVFFYLECEDLISVSKVCSVWNAAVNYVGLWNDVQWTITEHSDLTEIEAVLKYIPTVRNIKFKINCPECAYDTILENIIKHCNDIRSLHTGKYSKIDSDGLKSIIHKFPNIEELQLGHLDTKDRNILKTLQLCLNLKILKFGSLNYSGVSLYPIAAGCPELTHLDIQDLMPTNIDFADFLMAKKEKIQSLLFSVEDDNAYGITLGECKNLEHVSCKFYRPMGFTNEILDAIASLPKLKRLELLFYDPIRSSILINFFYSMSSRNVVELSLGLKSLSGEEAIAIGTGCPLIKKLSLEMRFDDFGDEPPPFTSLFQLPHLEDLELIYFTYSEIWFSQLLKCQTLRHLKLKHCFCLESHNAVLLLTDLNLVYLELSNCWFLKDSFLENFPTCVSLKQLEITECEFSKHSVEQLKRRHPSIVINWSERNICHFLHFNEFCDSNDYNESFDSD